MTKYEIMFIVKTTMEDDAIKKIAEDAKMLINGDSKVIEFKDLGKKKLAYEIKKQVNGAYYLIICEASNDVIKEFDRKCSINENILRHLILKLEDK